MDYEKHAAIDAIVPEEDFGYENEDESFDLGFEDDSQTTNEQTIQQVIKRIIKKKKEQGRFVLETWEIVLIIVGSVFVLGTATFLSVFLYKRKKKPLK